MCEGIEEEVISYTNGDNLIVEMIYKCDPLTIVSLVYYVLQNLITTRRIEKKTYHTYEARYAAKLSKFNTVVSSVAISKSLAALFMIENSNVDNEK